MEYLNCDNHIPPQILLSNFRMRKINGIELLQEVKSKYPEIKTLLITGNTVDVLDYEKEVNMKNILYHEIISKPFKFKELVNTLNVIKPFMFYK